MLVTLVTVLFLLRVTLVTVLFLLSFHNIILLLWGNYGEKPTPTNQGEALTCVREGVTKTILSSADYQGIDLEHKVVVSILEQQSPSPWWNMFCWICFNIGIMSANVMQGTVPTIFDGKRYQIRETVGNTRNRWNVKLRVTECQARDYDPKCEFVLCYLMKNSGGRHCVYIKSKESNDWSCINSHGENNQFPRVPINQRDNRIYKVEVTFEDVREWAFRYPLTVTVSSDTGLASNLYLTKMGVFSKTHCVYRNKPVYRNWNHSAEIFYSNQEGGHWVIGDNHKDDIGGMKTIKEGLVKIPRHGWQFSNGGIWTEDPILRVEEGELPYPERVTISSSGALVRNYPRSKLGLYTKTPDIHNGKPVWSKNDPSEKIFYNNDGHWIIGDKLSVNGGSFRTAKKGIVDILKCKWQFYNGKTWINDPHLTVEESSSGTSLPSVSSTASPDPRCNSRSASCSWSQHYKRVAGLWGAPAHVN